MNILIKLFVLKVFVMVRGLVRTVQYMCNIRSPGYWHWGDLRRFTAMVENVRGDFAEIGVWRGEASRKLIRLSSSQGKKIHLFDSFSGMDEPGSFDSGFHPKGRFDTGGLAGFRSIMKSHGFSDNEYFAYDGFIPTCFEKVPNNVRFSFVIIDVDYYVPTRDTLNWIWPLISRGGILVLDDFKPMNDMECSKAINEFLRERNDYYRLDFLNFQLFLRKEV
ncbi:hypothetical protein KsCSTR_34920 [Candidatus Kuenenia stuttgartiensis]|nr:hypothetical protein KsCSTR_34920 [Candidatus Kuenenia stuttgartiensis]